MLAWTMEWYVREETLREANTAIVDHRYPLELAKVFGGGRRAGSSPSRSPRPPSARPCQARPSTNHYQLVDPETYSWFEAPESNAMVGREHDGDENGISVVYFAMLTYLGRPVTLVNKRWSETYTEESHESKANPGEIMTGRKHFGDENGDTEYQYAVVTYY